MLGEPSCRSMSGEPSDHWMIGSSSSKVPLLREFQVNLFSLSPKRPPPLLIQNRRDRLDLFDSRLSLVHPATEVEQVQEDSQDATNTVKG
ncbi:unnamed protein product [Clonostachys byssicola]|uniref:Uncharacterized protein n=1 Tax=Clonostachys byssicola TaxID=160290 RepID=A0A9N9UBS4_9HYPO|nr:unnamed protein product [Clonostachys byssicola]